MKTTKTFSVLIWINASRAKNNQAELFARITVNQKRANFSLKRKIDINFWDKSKNQVKGSYPNAQIINQYLEQVKAKLFKIYVEFQTQDKTITANLINESFLGTDKKFPSLCELFEYHNCNFKNKLCQGTRRHYKTSQSYLKKFVKSHYKSSDIFLKDLNYAFVINFEMFLRAYAPTDHQRKMGQNTIMKHIQRLRKMVTMAYHMEWIDRDPFVRFKPTFEKHQREFLNEFELQSVINFTSDIKRLNLVKDLFVFSCYTGIAYVDIMQLTKDNILTGIDGHKWIITKRQKTGSAVKVPILDKARELIDKYKNNIRAEVSGTLFSVLSNQKLNSYLKEIADLCGIKKNLTFHMARHTFATTVTLTNGVPIETVSKLLGHTKLATTQIYAHVIERKVSQDMAALRNILSKKQQNLQNDLNQAH
jgi:integrase/recombinase XerD